MQNNEFDNFDDELRSMQELMAKDDIAISDESLQTSLRGLNLKPVIGVETGTSVKECVDKMLAHRIGCLVVIKDKKLVGIFTERDVLLKIAGENYDLTQKNVDQFMSPSPAYLSMDDSIKAALKLMHDGGYRHIVIVNENQEPQSVVSIKNIIDYIVEFFPQDVLNLPPHPIRFGTRHREGG
ncbi:MAG: CBS domain-containing protein [bacterium]